MYIDVISLKFDNFAGKAQRDLFDYVSVRFLFFFIEKVVL